MPEKAGPGFFYGWVIVGAGLLVWTLEGGMYASFGVFLMPLSSELGWTRAMVSGALSLASLVLGVLALVSGALVDRYGPRWLVMGSGLLTGLGYALTSRVESLWQFYLFYLLVGLGMGMAFGPVTATVLRWFEERGGLALGITSLGAGIGGMVFPPLAYQLVSLWGWRGGYLFLGAVLGGAVILAGAFLKRDPREMGLCPYGAAKREGEVTLSSPGRLRGSGDFSLRQAAGTAAYWRVFYVATVAVFSFVLMQVHLIPYAIDRGLTPAEAALAMAVLGAGNSVGRVGLGALSDRLSRKLTLFTVLAVGGVAMLLLMGAGAPWMFYLLALVFGLAYGGALVSWFSIPRELFGLSAMGAIVGSTQMGSNFGGAAGAFAAGYIFDATGSYAVAFLLSAALLLLGSGLIFFLSPPPKRSSPGGFA